MSARAQRASTATSGIVGAAMVGLLGGGSRLAIRAARVVLEDSYRPTSRTHTDGDDEATTTGARRHRRAA
jgi:hypothetical protein